MASKYPQINIRSKNEISKRISSGRLSQSAALTLINDVLENYDSYWRDSRSSTPSKQKFVRSAVGTPLHTLLKLIDVRILQPYDKLVPEFIFGGISGKSHLDAALSLTGRRNNRTLLKMDISRFYEQITRERVFYLFHLKFNCSVKASNILADLCCVPIGKKDSGNAEKTIARGFSTSSRLAVWTTLPIMMRMKWLVDQKLKQYDPRIVVFVDDIGITASKVPYDILTELQSELTILLANFDHNQPLPINDSKSEIISFHDDVEHLGVRLGRKKIALGRKTQSAISALNMGIQTSTGNKKRLLTKKRRSLLGYNKQIQKTNG